MSAVPTSEAPTADRGLSPREQQRLERREKLSSLHIDDSVSSIHVFVETLRPEDSPKHVKRSQHPGVGRSSDTPSSEVGDVAAPRAGECYDFRRGHCTRGAACKFLHDDAGPEPRGGQWMTASKAVDLLSVRAVQESRVVAFDESGFISSTMSGPSAPPEQAPQHNPYIYVRSLPRHQAKMIISPGERRDAAHDFLMGGEAHSRAKEQQRAFCAYHARTQRQRCGSGIAILLESPDATFASMLTCVEGPGTPFDASDLYIPNWDPECCRQIQEKLPGAKVMCTSLYGCFSFLASREVAGGPSPPPVLFCWADYCKTADVAIRQDLPLFLSLPLAPSCFVAITGSLRGAFRRGSDGLSEERQKSASRALVDQALNDSPYKYTALLPSHPAAGSKQLTDRPPTTGAHPATMPAVPDDTYAAKGGGTGMLFFSYMLRRPTEREAQAAMRLARAPLDCLAPVVPVA
jgi:hypothetical protein